MNAIVYELRGKYYGSITEWRGLVFVLFVDNGNERR
jgi:hypothetical protein